MSSSVDVGAGAEPRMLEVRLRPSVDAPRGNKPWERQASYRFGDYTQWIKFAGGPDEAQAKLVRYRLRP